MKLRNIILMTASIAMTACSKQAVPTAIPEDAKIEQQVEELLSKMDLDAKIGQMTELAIDVLQYRLSTFAPLPAPEVPDLASMISVLGSMIPSFTKGYVDKKEQVGKQPGLAISLASLILSRLPACETAVDMLYFKTVWKIKEKYLSGQEKKDLTQCFGTRMDMLQFEGVTFSWTKGINLDWIQGINLIWTGG